MKSSFVIFENILFEYDDFKNVFASNRVKSSFVIFETNTF